MPTPKRIKDYYTHSTEWKLRRKAIRHKYRGICQDCGKAGWEVHHIIALKEDNFNLAEIRIGEDNLMLLCTKCHNARRTKDTYIRADIAFDIVGNIISNE